MDEGQATLGEALKAAYDAQTKDDEAIVEAIVDSEVEEVVEAVEEEEIKETPQEVKPPEHWSDDDKTAFLAMDDSGRDWALRLEANASKGIQEKAEELKKFRTAFEPYKHLIPPGTDEVAVIQQLLNAQAVLTRNPKEGIEWLKKQYGVDEKQKPADDPDEFVDPEIRALKEQIQQMQSQSEEQARDAEVKRQQAMYAEIRSFKDKTDDDGKLMHPHYDTVQGVMAGLLSTNRAKDLEDAYQQAVWAVPEYRDSEVEKRAKEAAEAELKAKSEAAKKAQQASKTVKGKSSAKKASAPQTMGDALRENYEKSIRGE